MKHLVFVLMILLPALCFGQDRQHPKKSPAIQAISFSLLNESLAFPFTRFSPIHPGAELGLTFLQQDRNKSMTQWNAYLGGFYHENVETALYLKGEFLYRYQVHPNVGMDLMGGLGYVHHFYPGTLYEVNGETGDFTEVQQFGKARAMAELGIGITYTNDSRFEPFVKQSFAVKSPFANGIPVIPHSFLKVGVSYKF